MTIKILCILCWIIHASADTVRLPWGLMVGDQGTTTINIGDTVTWMWSDMDVHSVTSYGSAEGLFDSGVLNTATFSYTFTAVGSVPYECSIHNSMNGVIEVIGTDPTMAPTLRPTAQPSASLDLSPYLANLLVAPKVFSSGNSTPQNWNATLHVREYRVVTPVVSYNTRAYCFDDASAQMVCSAIGPTIVLTPGDNFTLTLINDLGNNTEVGTMNEMRLPNTTNIHTHGLHIDPKMDDVYKAAEPEGGKLVYMYQLPITHSPGLHWYHAHVHGSAAVQIMGGLLGALIVQPPAAQAGLSDISTDMNTPFNMNIPDSIRDAQSFLVVITYVAFTQATSNGVVSQGCGVGWACDPYSQAPLCLGNETSSPYNPFREYTYPELAADSHSTMEINAVFDDSAASSTSTTRNYNFVNGQYQPSIVVREDEPFVLRIVHATGGGPLPLTLSDSEVCNMSVIAWDGVYLDASMNETQVNMVAASRVDVQVLCNGAGLYSLNNGNNALMYFVVNATDGTSDYAYITDDDLRGINRPYYLADLTGDVAVQSEYSVTISQSLANTSVCGFWIGAGTNCSNITNAVECPYQQFEGERGLTTAPYVSDNKLVTYTGAVNEWKFYGMGSAFHPLHLHVNHFQIIDYYSKSDPGNDKYMRKGQWRDTIPPMADVLTFRFPSADFIGETMLHCHFLRHEDLGMMDSFLVTDYATYLTTLPQPSAAPTAAPSVAPTSSTPDIIVVDDDSGSNTLSGAVVGATVVAVLAVVGVGIWLFSRNAANAPQVKFVELIRVF